MVSVGAVTIQDFETSVGKLRKHTTGIVTNWYNKEYVATDQDSASLAVFRVIKGKNARDYILPKKVLQVLQ